jgi:hypothetical protein
MTPSKVTAATLTLALAMTDGMMKPDPVSALVAVLSRKMPPR